MADVDERVGTHAKGPESASGLKNHKEIAHAKWMLSGMLALSMAGMLTAMSDGLRQLNLMQWAMACFALSIPISAFYLFVSSASEFRPIVVGRLGRWVTTLGIIVAVAGFSLMLWAVYPVASRIFIVTSMFCLKMAMFCEERGDRKQQAQEKETILAAGPR